MESNYGRGESNYGWGESSRRSRGYTARTYGESAESRESSYESYTPTKKKYNSLDDIDKLIEQLETSMNGTNIKSERINEVLAQRSRKIEALKKLVEDARIAEEENKVIKQLEQENNEIDEAIEKLSKGLRR